MPKEEFENLILSITSDITGRSVNGELMDYLNDRYPPDGTEFQKLSDACRKGIAEGWLCHHEQGGIKFGRVIKAGEATHGFSVDVVDMEDIVGPHHRHPNGEIDMVIPETEGARFDNHGAGWVVYGPDSAHSPTVSNGRAIVLYLLPDGAIEFTGS
ncbi:MAG: DUF4863 family protein [Gammaproteobacteria bacterium]